jgi:N-acetylglucosaminyldiphosphoundecaprenol N-acetyl-beta-D-mannosaminyltransferase
MGTRPLILSPAPEAPAAESFELLGVRISAVQISDVVQRMEGWIEERRKPRFVAVANTHMIVEAQQDASFKQVLNAADLCVPDGMPLIWYGRFRKYPLARRVYGPELMSTFCRDTAPKGFRHYFYGGAPGVPDEMVKRLKESIPEIQIAGFDSPPFRALTPEEEKNAIERINRANPDIVWVGLGCPKQERWMWSHRGPLSAPVMVGVGQAFDLLSGRKKSAPAWMREHGLEWSFRLIQEPRRLWRRYLVYNAKFAAALFLEILRVGNSIEQKRPTNLQG